MFMIRLSLLFVDPDVGGAASRAILHTPIAALRWAELRLEIALCFKDDISMAQSDRDAIQRAVRTDTMG